MTRKINLKKQALRYIVAFEKKHHYPPTGDEVATALHVSRSYGYVLLDRLEQEGLITRPKHTGSQATVGRALRLTSAAMKALQEDM